MGYFGNWVMKQDDSEKSVVKTQKPEKDQKPAMEKIILIDMPEEKEEQHRVSVIKVDKNNDFLIPPEIFKNVINVYTDGSCIRNGKPDARAGMGVYFGDKDPRNISKPVEGKQTNNTAELGAILIACDILKKEIDEGKRIVVYTDSEYAIKCFTTYGRKLMFKNFKTDKPIPNLDLLKKGLELFATYPNLTLKHIRSHTGKKDEHSIGNEMADQLANQAIGVDAEKKESSKIYLNVAYANKDNAKEMGAKWDKSKKKWFVNESYKNSQVLVEKFGSSSNPDK